MKKIIFLLLFCSGFVLAQNLNTIAILYFDNASLEDREKLEPMRKGLADMFVTEMIKVKGLKITDRNRIQSLIDEMNLNELDIVNESTQQKMGKILGAQYMLFGTFNNLPSDEIRIDARVVKVETSEILFAEEETGDVDELMELIQSITKKIAKNLNVKLSKTEEKNLETESADFDAYYNYYVAIDLDDEARKLTREGKFDEAISKIEKAKTYFDKAFSLAKNYEQAKIKSAETISYKEKINQLKNKPKE